MANYTRNTLTGSLAPVNTELEKIEQSLKDKLDRNPSIAQSNELLDDLDANSKRIFNLAAPSDPNDAVRLKDLQESSNAAILPPQEGQDNEFLKTNGTTAFWDAVDKADVGLGNADNTSDINKPISTATQTELSKKASYVQTFTSLVSLSPSANDVFVCVERANAEYIVQPSGYVALAGDVTFSNGLIGELQISSPVNAGNFGVSGDELQDASPFMNNITSRLFASGIRGQIRLPSGVIRITQPFILSGTSMSLEGNNAEFSSTLLVDFVGTTIDNSSGVIVKGRWCGVKNLSIKGSATRKAASHNQFAAGILINPPSSAGNNTWFGSYDNLDISNHQGTGILSIGANWLTKFSNLKIYDNKGHGMRFDNGELISRSIKENPGQVDLVNVMIHDNAGNGLYIGNDDSVSNRGFRFNITNADLYRNAEASGSRKSPDQMWAFMDTSIISCSAFDGTNIAETAVVTRGIKLAGRAVTIKNSRFLEVTPQAIFISDLDSLLGYKTYGIEIDKISIFNTTPVDELVSYDPTVRNITISPQTEAGFNGMSPLTFSIPITKRIESSRTVSTQTVSNSTTPVDIDGLSTFLINKEAVQFKAVILYRGSDTADIKIGLSAPSGANVWFSPSGGILVGTSDTASVSSVTFSTSSTFQFGCASGNGTRVAVIIGECKTTGTAGDLKIKFSQNSAEVSDTQVLSQSYLEVTRC